MSNETGHTGEAAETNHEPATAASNEAPATAETSATNVGAPTVGAPTNEAPREASAGDEGGEWEEEAGDDVGNQAQGEGEARPAGEAGAPPKKKRRRRKKKPGAGAEGAAQGAEGGAQGAEGAEAGEGAEGEGAREGGERRGKKKPAERPAFRVGEDVFGKVAKVTATAIWVDIAGKAMGLFERSELEALAAEAPAAVAAAEAPADASEGASGEGASGEGASAPADATSSDASDASDATSSEPSGDASNEAASSEASVPAASVPAAPEHTGAIALPEVGDQFVGTIASTGVRGGMLLLSRRPKNIEVAKKALDDASQTGALLGCLVTGVVKGGVEVDFGGVRAFAPASHVDPRPGADLTKYVGEKLDFAVIQYARKGRDVVVSRRRLFEGEAKKAREEALSKLAVGSVHKGIVRSVVQWGVFVALPEAGGVEGLVHVSQATHERGKKLEEIFRPGEEVEVKVLKVDDKGKIWLSRKSATPDPWDEVAVKYAAGTRHKGRIVRLQPFGAFIELEPGIDGLCHVADLSFKNIDHPNEVVKMGDDIDVVVASCDAAQRRIALHPAPPADEASEPRQKIQVGKMVKVAVVNVTDGGVVARILGLTGRAARGFIPAGHSGVPRGGDLRKEMPVGTKLDVKVLEIDRRGEAKLSVRALREDAEKAAYNEYRAGVAREAKFGTFGDLFKNRK